MAYQFHHLSDHLVLIVWERYPSSAEERQFLVEHREQLDNATQPIFYLSDLRRGRIITLSTLRHMSELVKHSKYGGGAAFSRDPISHLMVKSFRSLSHEATSKAAMFENPEDALEFLEGLCQGITVGIEWNVYIAPQA